MEVHDREDTVSIHRPTRGWPTHRAKARIKKVRRKMTLAALQREREEENDLSLT